MILDGSLPAVMCGQGWGVCWAGLGCVRWTGLGCVHWTGLGCTLGRAGVCALDRAMVCALGRAEGAVCCMSDMYLSGGFNGMYPGQNGLTNSPFRENKGHRVQIIYKHSL